MKSKLLLLVTFIASFLTFTSSNVSAASYCSTYSTGNGNPNNTYVGWMSISSPPTNPAFSYTTLSSWNSLSLEQKLLTYPLYTDQIPFGGCSLLNARYTDTTVFSTTTFPPVTTIPLTTTTLPRWRHYCVPYNSYTWYQQTLDSLYYTYPPTAVYPVPVGGCSSLNLSPPTTTANTSTTTTTITTTTTTTTTVPKVLNYSNYSFPTPSVTSKPKTKKVRVKQTTFYRTGAICADGWRSRATGSGACSWHGGVYKWLGYNQTTWVTKTVPIIPKAPKSSNNCYYCISSITGLPKTSYVNGYFRSDGTYVNGYWRSP